MGDQNPSVKCGKVLEIIVYKGRPDEVGMVGLVVNVDAKKPCVIIVYEVKDV